GSTGGLRGPGCHRGPPAGIQRRQSRRSHGVCRHDLQCTAGSGMVGAGQASSGHAGAVRLGAVSLGGDGAVVTSASGTSRNGGSGLLDRAIGRRQRPGGSYCGEFSSGGGGDSGLLPPGEEIDGVGESFVSNGGKSRGGAGACVVQLAESGGRRLDGGG